MSGLSTSFSVGKWPLTGAAPAPSCLAGSSLLSCLLPLTENGLLCAFLGKPCCRRSQMALPPRPSCCSPTPGSLKLPADASSIAWLCLIHHRQHHHELTQPLHIPLLGEPVVSK